MCLNMADRDYFSLRYAIPGYAFILVLIATNYRPFIEIALNSGLDSVFGAFLAFISLFTGSALGFLVSQIWYMWYNHKGGVFGIPQMQKVKEELKETLGIKFDESNSKSTNEETDVILDYILNDDDNLSRWRYIQRRIDMYHTLSCTAISLFLGLALGFCLRIYYEGVVFQWIGFKQLCTDLAAFGWGELVGQVFVFVVLSLLGCGIWKIGRENPLANYRQMLMAIIRDIDYFKKEKLKKLFSQFFP